MKVFRKFIDRVTKCGKRRAGERVSRMMGRERVFEAWDLGADTFVFERGVAGRLADRPSVLAAKKRDLGGAGKGFVMTISTGNHAVAAFPLLDGRFWHLARLDPERRSDALMRSVVCANIVDDRLELSQREVEPERLFAVDGWLVGGLGFALGDIVLGERTDEALMRYRARGEEWRVKPLAWSETEIKTAIRASRKRIASELRYYHAMRGTHFLSFSEFRRLTELARDDFAAFADALTELVGVYEGQTQSFARTPKFRGHHEIEFFGLERGAAPERMISGLEDLYSKLKRGEIGQLGAIQMIDEAAKLYESLLSRPEFADEESQTFAETIYMYLTGEIYSVVGEGSIPAFDDRRTALPGGGFVDGRPVMHPGSDARTGVLFSTLVEMMSKGEKIEYANVYEIRDEDNLPIGKGRTREIVFKTNLRPLESSLIEKTLSSAKKGYGDYLLARIGALRALGISLSGYYRLLPRSAGSGRHDHYFRFRCEGETMDSIPANYFGTTEDSSIEDPEVVCGLATLMGDAAAQNMAMKKYDTRSSSALYGVGKEIYAFEYDIIRERVVPKSVSICSIRGSLGWPCLDRTEENLSNIAGWYLAYFAHALKEFQKKHRVPMRELAERFFGGFEYRTHAMVWQMSIMRDRFEAFAPELRRVYDFQEKWSFVMWALERQDRRLPILKKKFFEKVRVLEDEEGRDNPQ